MPGLNEKQEELCGQLDGFIVVDAGPGTGKTHTIVDRYIRTLNSNVDPMKVLMLTFTRNAATEMEERITARISGITSAKNYDGPLINADKNLRVSTMDSFCLDVVLNSPEKVKDFFDKDDNNLMLSRSATLVENETLNEQYFAEFYANFINEHREEYIFGGYDVAATLGEKPMDVYEALCRLMSRGILPEKKGWNGRSEQLLMGTQDVLRESMIGRAKDVKSKIDKGIKDGDYPRPNIYNGEISEEIIDEAVFEDRSGLFELIHDVYYSYITECIKNNRLTFGLCELFAYIILKTDKKSRAMHSVDFLTIDEFQDTNELQMKICLLLLNKPNMCVVGDWKQGIFGFRYVGIENITKFKKRIQNFIDDLEREGVSFPFETWRTSKVDFNENYRSSQKILDIGFDSIDIPATRNEIVEHDEVVPLTAVKDEEIKKRNGEDFKCILGKDEDDEIRKAVDLITEYRFKGGYKVIDIEGETVSERDVDFGDIAVLCRTGKNCISMYNECRRRKIPVYLQGDIEVMSTMEGKLALAWLRLVNNPKDERALVAILAFKGYPLSEIERIGDSKWKDLPEDILNNLGKLNQKKRRLNDLVTSIFDICGLNNEVVHTIINVLASAHSNSLMTISDLIRLMEDDIESGTKYNVEPKLDNEAVIIQTIHKSKGLEYPAVIVVGLNQSSFPNFRGDDNTLIYNDKLGLRCTNSYISGIVDGEKREMIVKSWRTAIARSGIPPDYSEERRLLFVAMTRAKQYLAITAHDPSAFFNYYQERHGTSEPKAFDIEEELKKKRSLKPDIGDYKKHRESISLHDLMDTIVIPEGAENHRGKGKDYGEEVHQMAYLYLRRRESYLKMKVSTDDDSEKKVSIDEKYPEMKFIRKIIDDRRDCKISGETKCVLPVDDVAVKGTIDLIAEYDDRIEIHDYKTDPDTRYEPRYRFQLGVYALAAQSLGKKVRCFIHYVCIGETKETSPITMDDVRERIEAYRENMRKSVW